MAGHKTWNGYNAFMHPLKFDELFQ